MNNKGLTLIELIISITLISMLSFVGAQSLQRFIKKSYKTEAKMNLAAVHRSQQAHFQACESYFPDLSAIGLQITGKIHYNIGGNFQDGDFSTSCADSTKNCSARTNTNCQNFLVKTTGNTNFCSRTKARFKDPNEQHKTCFFKSASAIADLNAYTGALTDDDKKKIYGEDFNDPKSIYTIKKSEYLIFAASDPDHTPSDTSTYNVWVINHHGVPEDLSLNQ